MSDKERVKEVFTRLLKRNMDEYIRSEIDAAQNRRYALDHPVETMLKNSEKMTEKYGADWRNSSLYGMSVGNGEDAVNLLYATPYWSLASAFHTGKDAYNLYRNRTAENATQFAINAAGRWLLPYGIGKLAGAGTNVFSKSLLTNTAKALKNYPKTALAGLAAGSVGSVPFIREPIRKYFSPYLMNGFSWMAKSSNELDAGDSGTAGTFNATETGVVGANPNGGNNNNWIEYGQRDFWPKEGDAKSSIAQGSYLMSRPDQDKWFKLANYKRDDNHFTKKYIWNAPNYPLYVRNEDVANPDTLKDLGFLYAKSFTDATGSDKTTLRKAGWFGNEQDGLIHANDYPTHLYADEQGKLYQAGIDLNNYGGTSGFGDGILDGIGNPVYVSTGLRPTIYHITDLPDLLHGVSDMHKKWINEHPKAEMFKKNYRKFRKDSADIMRPFNTFARKIKH